jgi:hypothetical protein
MSSVFLRARFAQHRRRIAPLLAATLGVIAGCPAATLPVIQWQIVENRLTLHEAVIIRLSAEAALRKKCKALVSIITNPSIGAENVEEILVSILRPCGILSLTQRSTYGNY